MATVAEAQQSQLRNIETSTGRSIDDWVELIRASGRSRHGEIVPWLKSEYGLSHGTAHRLALVSIDRLRGAGPAALAASLEDALYPENRRHLLPLHEALLRAIHGLGDDIELAPKKGYVSIRRRKQFAMLQPAAKHIDLGLILADAPAEARDDARDQAPGEARDDARDQAPAEARTEARDDAKADARLEPAASFNALFTNRVRIRSIEDIDAELIGWLSEAYEAAG